ncbi:DUF1189 family protein [Vaginisenegalia massiliensis]|uniref:DUF1189 family protein n=1 Tax=Vaginisenegalia massiliensis TaxID=2058294 RepID=UPI0013DD9F8F|nr:DUF1189 family protein [Vaginisenegalia massiliensis]
MKNLFKLIRQGLDNPRYFVETIRFDWTQLLILNVLACLLMALSISSNQFPYLQKMDQDIQQMIQIIPNYSFKNHELQLASKPLYYQTDLFQLVFDDQVDQTNPQKSLSLPDNKADLINPEIPMGLYAFKKQTYLVVNQRLVPFKDFNQLSISRKGLIKYLASLKKSLPLLLFVVSFFGSMISYWLLILLIGLLAGFFNARLSKRVPLASRIKLAMTTSFIPWALVQIIAIVIPGFQQRLSLIVFASLWLIYQAFKEHTRFVHALMEQLQELNQHEDDMNKKED